MGLDVTGKYRYPPPDTDWLAQYSEEIIEPDLKIIDPHHHLWEEANHAYLLPELEADLSSGHNIVATVFVEAKHGYLESGPEELKCTGETQKAMDIVSMAQKAGIDTAVCAAIVGFADLTLGDKAGEVIDTHKQICKGRLRGIRSSVSRDPHFPEGIVIKPAKDRLLFDPEYRKGLVQIAESDLCYEAMLYHCQIKELAACARALPDLPIILDHIGCIIGVGPYRGNERETFKIWRNDMKELSGCDNVMVKLGGFGMIICGPTWHERDYPPTSEELAKAWRPYVETCIEFFGAERCMFESNFPVDKAMYSYPVLWNAFKRLSSGYSEAERGALFYNTAARVYRI